MSYLDILRDTIERTRIGSSGAGIMAIEVTPTLAQFLDHEADERSLMKWIDPKSQRIEREICGVPIVQGPSYLWNFGSIIIAHPSIPPHVWDVEQQVMRRIVL